MPTTSTKFLSRVECRRGVGCSENNFEEKQKFNLETGDGTGDRRLETGDRRQETEDRRQKTGDRRQMTGNRRQET